MQFRWFCWRHYKWNRLRLTEVALIGTSRHLCTNKNGKLYGVASLGDSIIAMYHLRHHNGQNIIDVCTFLRETVRHLFQPYGEHGHNNFTPCLFHLDVRARILKSQSNHPAMVKQTSVQKIRSDSPPNNLPGKNQEIEARAQKSKSSNILAANRRRASQSHREPLSKGKSPRRLTDSLGRAR